MLRLIRDDETIKLTFGDTWFEVCVRSHGYWEDLRARFTKQGKADEKAMRDAGWSENIKNWGGLADEDGSDLPYSQDEVVRVSRKLPDTVAGQITIAMRGGAKAYHEAAGN